MSDENVLRILHLRTGILVCDMLICPPADFEDDEDEDENELMSWVFALDFRGENGVKLATIVPVRKPVDKILTTLLIFNVALDPSYPSASVREECQHHLEMVPGDLDIAGDFVTFVEDVGLDSDIENPPMLGTPRIFNWKQGVFVEVPTSALKSVQMTCYPGYVLSMGDDLVKQKIRLEVISLPQGEEEACELAGSIELRANSTQTELCSDHVQILHHYTGRTENYFRVWVLEDRESNHFSLFHIPVDFSRSPSEWFHLNECQPILRTHEMIPDLAQGIISIQPGKRMLWWMRYREPNPQIYISQLDVFEELPSSGIQQEHRWNMAATGPSLSVSKKWTCRTRKLVSPLVPDWIHSLGHGYYESIRSAELEEWSGTVIVTMEANIWVLRYGHQ